MEPWERIVQLKQIISHHNQLYYEQDNPQIDDYEYDALIQELIALEEAYPLLATPDSPTQKVGGSALDRFAKVTHNNIMQSLGNAFSRGEISDFLLRVRQAIGDTDEFDFVVEQKIDGLSVSIEYTDGQLSRASTRGDGQVGEDITHNIKALEHLPKTLAPAIPYLEVRGEVYMPFTTFEKINELAEINGDKIFSNPRNAAAGSLRQLDAGITAQRGLEVFVFNIQEINGMSFDTHASSLDFLASLGFMASPGYRVCQTEEEIWQAICEIGDSRGKLNYGIDGAVVKLNQIPLRKLLGQTSKAPRWAIAFKYPPEQKQTRINQIDVQVGRTGKLTPVAILEPVFIAGSTVARATLNNEDFIDEKDIREGDMVILQKAGDVIPEVISVLTEHRPTNSHPFVMPSICPVCHAPVVREEGGAISRCTGVSCPAQLLGRIIHFVSKDALDITGLGPAVIEALLDQKLISSVADLFSLEDKKPQLLQMDRMGATSVQNLLSAIDRARNCTLDRLIVALGIRNVGVVAARTLAAHYNNLRDIEQASLLELAALPDFGLVTAQSILDFFAQEQTQQLLNELSLRGVKFDGGTSNISVDNRFEGKVFVLTGTLPNLSRDQVSALILSHGGKVSSAVSKKTDFVLVGESAGSKLLKAQSLGLTILTEDDFRQMLSS